MKVIGTTKGGYLLEAASWEVSYLSNGVASEKRASWGSEREDALQIAAELSYDAANAMLKAREALP